LCQMLVPVKTGTCARENGQLKKSKRDTIAIL